MEHFQRILVITPAQLGDVLLCTPLIHLARARWPDARIDVLGFARTLELLAGNPDVSELIEIPATGGRGAQLRQAWKLRRRYDLALVTRSSDRSHLYGIVCARIRSAVIPGGGPGSYWKRRMAQHGLVPAPQTHQVLQKLQLLEPWVDPPATLSLLPPAAAPLPPAIEARIARPCVVVHVPSMWSYKQWPPEHFRRVVEGLLADEVQVILTGADSPNDRSQIEQMLGTDTLPGVLDVSGQLSIAQLSTLLQRADAYLGPDTSVTHLAAAVGVPIVTVFGPTNPQDFGPWPRHHPATQPWRQRAGRQQVGNIVVLQGPDLPGRTCVPCNQMGCGNRHDSPSQCLLQLEPERVLSELRLTLQRAGVKQDGRAAASRSAADIQRLG
jgi:heptosyltransferase-3